MDKIALILAFCAAAFFISATALLLNPASPMPAQSSPIQLAPQPSVQDALPTVVTSRGNITVPSREDILAIFPISLDEALFAFNTRYGQSLSLPMLSMDAPFYNNTRAYYYNDTVYFPGDKYWQHPDPTLWVYDSKESIDKDVLHEFCHYIQDNYCGMGYNLAESFCQIYAGTDNSHCEPNETQYCSPFQTNKVDRQGFLDCVLNSCSGQRSYAYMMDCYKKNLYIF